MYTLGHRSALGLAMHPGTGEMWLNENGPNGGDEINILKPGASFALSPDGQHATLPLRSCPIPFATDPERLAPRRLRQPFM